MKIILYSFNQRFVVVLVSLLVSAICVSGATKYSTGTGNWNTGTTWSPSGVPANSDVVIIQSGHTVTLDANMNNLNSLTINAGGQLATTSTNTVTATIIVVDGVYLNGSTGAIIINSGGSMSVNSGGTYKHNIDGGTIPTATWNAASTCLITGVISTLPSALTQAFGNFTWNCSGQTGNLSFAASLLTINGNFTVQDTYTGSFYLVKSVGGGGTRTLNVGGDFRMLGGNMVLCNSSGTMVMNVGGSFIMSGGTLTNGSGTGIVNFAGTTTQTVSKTGGTISGAVAFNILGGAIVDFGTSYIDGTSATFNLNAGGTLITASPDGINAWWPLNVGAIQVGGSRTYNSSSNYVYNGTVAQATGNGLSAANNLTISNPAGVTLTNNTTVQGLILTNGIVTSTSSTILTVQNSSASAITGGSATSFVSGPLIRRLPANLASGTTYSFPIGKGGVYKALDLVNPTTDTWNTADIQVEVNNSNPGGSVNAPLSSKSTTEYWDFYAMGNLLTGSVSLHNETGVSSFNCIAGSTASNGTYSLYNGATQSKAIINSSTFGPLNSAHMYFALAKGSPTIYLTGTPLSSFTYSFGNGPSAEQSFTVAGVCLDGNILITPPTDFEISLGSGAFTPQSFITLPVVTNVVTSTIIKVRLKAGLAQGAVAAQNIVISSFNATNQNVVCQGIVAPSPTISFEMGTLSGLDYSFTQGPSGDLTFGVKASSLTENIVIGPSQYFEFSADGTTYTPSLTIDKNASALAEVDWLDTYAVHVRLKDALSIGNYSEVIYGTSTIASASITISGTIRPRATLITSVSSLTGFIYTAGSGPSGSQTFQIKGTNLTNNVVVEPLPSTYYEVSKDGSTWAATQTYNRSGNSLDWATVHVRLKSGVLSGTTCGSPTAPINIIVSSTGAPVKKNVALTGKVVGLNTRIILVANSLLEGFGYLVGNGANSIIQTTTVSGAGLTANIVLTAPTNYEISTSAGGTYSSSLTLGKVGSKVDPTIIYIRIISGKTAATYNGTLTATTTSGTTINLTLNGAVYNPPSISASSGSPICQGSPLVLDCVPYVAINQYWTGPNNFYSVLKNPTVTTSAQLIHSGTYTIVGSYLIGPNLAYNGDFDQGNAGFSSEYGCQTDLTAEGKYYVGSNPNTYHSGFTSCSDHTNAGSRYQMIINAAVVKGQVVWSQSIKVKTNTQYQFSYFLQSVVAGNPSRLQLYVNGIAAGPVYKADSVTCSWKQFTYNHNTGTDTYANLELINQNTVAGGNDFALDDIVYREAVQVTGSTNVAVTPAYNSATVSLVASKNPISPGSSVTFTATPSNAGPSPQYLWKVNGTQVGVQSTDNTYQTTTLNDNDVVSCTVIPAGGCSTPASPTASITMTVTPNSNFWVGAVDNSWTNISNWSKGIIPPAGDDVEFATEGNNGVGNAAKRDLFVDGERTIGSLINNTDKKIIVPSTKTLVVNNLVKTGSDVNRIWIQSDPSVTNGSLIFLLPSLNPSVAGTVEMYSKAAVSAGHNRWQFFGIPIQSTVANPTFGGSYVRIPDETATTQAAHWVYLNNESVLNKFQGYEITQPSDKTVFFQGNLVTSDFDSGVLPYSVVGKLPYTSTARYPGQYLFANSYTAAIDIKKLSSAFGSNVEKSIYLFNTGSFYDWTLLNGETTGGSSPGQYTVSTPGSAGTPGIPATIPSMQAFLIKLNGNDLPNSDLKFSYSSVIIKNTEAQRVRRMDSNHQEEAPKKEYLRMIVSGEKYSDQAWLINDTACTRKFDNGFDGRKIKGSGTCPQIYAIEGEEEYQIDMVDDLSDTQIGFEPGEDTQYKLTILHENLMDKYENIYLIDLYEKKAIDITESGTEYSFSKGVNDTTGGNRFQIVTNKIKISNNEISSLDNKLRVLYFNNEIYIENKTDESGTLYLYDVSGHLIKSLQFSPQCITYTSAVVPYGVYVIKAQTMNHKMTKSIITCKVLTQNR